MSLLSLTKDSILAFKEAKQTRTVLDNTKPITQKNFGKRAERIDPKNKIV